MRTTRIDVTGSKRDARAELTRDGANVIATVYEGGQAAAHGRGRLRVHSHIVGASQREELYEMARRVQHALDGCVGTNGDVEDYWQAIQKLAD
jgi:hypothetical protein